jgi:ribosomal protein L37AE/L43A
MCDQPKPPDPGRPAPALHVAPAEGEAMVCERCGGANVYRMHAVWRCADCGFKTDCCGW